jgi:multisubunit Na+/H+ antiporter MnhG subunit
VTVLVVVGIAVAVFGALVLLRFPDRPGGKIAWRGFEVSSVGTGLPLIALGVAALALASSRGEIRRSPCSPS